MNYCTLFNSHYLSRGLALYESLQQVGTDFHLTIFAFDQPAYEILTKLNMVNTTIISLDELETPELLAVKRQRSTGEYCWTCTPATILYCLEKLGMPQVCYLDADLYFFADPKPLIDEAEKGSILITEHRYTPCYDNSLLSGKYCVQFMFFKNDERGLRALHWWNEACLEWCYDRVEPGRFGDQKYLDDWTERFEGVEVLQHLGGGVAPWNVQQYDVKSHRGLQVQLKAQADGQLFDLIFYHFHALKFINQQIDFGSYQLSKSVIESIYRPYVNALLQVERQLHSLENLQDLLKLVNMHAIVNKELTVKDHLRRLKKRWQGIDNTASLTEFV